MEIEKIREKVLNCGVKIVFPEGEDRRIRKAAEIIESKKYARVLILEDCEKPLYKGASMVANGEADAMVAGAAHPTSAVFKAALKMIGLKRNRSIASSFFLMESDNKKVGEKGSFLFADCAIVPQPSERELAVIACMTAESAAEIFGWKPRVAFLSFSTKGSSSHPSADRVSRAAKEVENMEADFVFDGELQFDAAVIPSVAKRKDPAGKIEGKANVLVFPDLNSANIGYKITERLGGFTATGPILQGFKKPINDLSRGCSVDDIVSVSCFTALQALYAKEKKGR